MVESSLNRIANCFPLLWASECQSHLRFQVRLVEHWEDLVAVEGFKLSVQVLILVTLVSVLVETHTVLVVSI
jgi:hypothetical protein